MSEIKVLFVDHQQDNAELKELISSDSSHSRKIDLVSSGGEALKYLEKGKYDVIVSEMAMPEMDGAQLMKRVRTLYPGIVRFIYSGSTDREQVLQTVGYVHRYVARPCSPDRFWKIVDNSLGLRSMIFNEEMHTKIASVGALPSPPELYNELIKELQSEDTSLRHVADLIKKDIGITAKLLQMINSAFFGLPTHIESTFHAVKLLGLDTVKSLVLTAGVFNQFQDNDIPGITIDSIYNRSLAVGTSARHIANVLSLPTRQLEDSLMAGMLHDVGKLVMLTNFPKELGEAVQMEKSKRIPLNAAINEVLGVSDAAIGAHLLSLWGLPDSILEAVALRYLPRQTPAPIINVLTSVHLAYALDCDHYRKIKDENESAIDREYLEKLDLITVLPNLRNFCMAATS